MFNLQAKGYNLKILTITEDTVSTFVMILGPWDTRVQSTGLATKKGSSMRGRRDSSRTPWGHEPPRLSPLGSEKS